MNLRSDDDEPNVNSAESSDSAAQTSLTPNFTRTAKKTYRLKNPWQRNKGRGIKSRGPCSFGLFFCLYSFAFSLFPELLRRYFIAAMARINIRQEQIPWPRAASTFRWFRRETRLPKWGRVPGDSASRWESNKDCQRGKSVRAPLCAPTVCGNR